MSDRPKRKLIEVALPLEAINVASAREKANPFLRDHPRGLHQWWARRPLAACRAIIFASLVDDPSSDPVRFPTPKAVEDERTRIFSILERLVQWENSANEAVLEEARAEIRRSTGGNPPPVLDPFCGAGSIPLEAQRLGLTAYASDLNPVAVLITKALIEIPPKFASNPPVHPDARSHIGAGGAWSGAAGLAEDIRRYGAWMRDEAERRIGHLYPKVHMPQEHGGGEAPVIAWLWARTVTCPNPVCGARMPLIWSFELSKSKGKEAWLEPTVDAEAREVRFSVATGPQMPAGSTKSGRGGSFRCLVCDQVINDTELREAGLNHRMATQLLAIVAQGRRGPVYVSPEPEHERLALSLVAPDGPDGRLSENARHSTPPTYGMKNIADLFSARQLIALVAYGDLIGEVRDHVRRDWIVAHADGREDRSPRTGADPASGYANAVCTYLALAVDHLARFSSTLTPWNGTNQNVAHMFGRQAFSMTWDFAESNVISGPLSFTTAAGWVAAAIGSLPPGAPAAYVSMADARHVESPSAMVSTDPPYYDNVPFADLSDFFYSWLRRTERDIYPELFGTILTPKAAELVADPVRSGGRDGARRHFEDGLEAAFKRMASVANRDYPVTVFYAFKQTEASSAGSPEAGSRVATGWETMLEGLLRAHFAIVGTWPIRTERAGRLRAAASNALASSIVLVCRPRDDDSTITTRRDFASALNRELPEAIRTLQHGNIAPVDLAQASIGPGMAVFSRYEKVLEPDGSPMRVRTALAMINQALDELLTEQEGEFDADTRWAIAWFEQFGLKDADFGTADVLARAKNTSVGGLVEAGIVAAARGRARLLARDEYSAGWDPAKDARVPVWEATQRLVQVLLTDGEATAGNLLARLGGLGDTARDLAYRMYHVAERKGWTDEARAYNALVVAWSDLARGAESARVSEPAQASLGLE